MVEDPGHGSLSWFLTLVAVTIDRVLNNTFRFTYSARLTFLLKLSWSRTWSWVTFRLAKSLECSGSGDHDPRLLSSCGKKSILFDDKEFITDSGVGERHLFPGSWPSWGWYSLSSILPLVLSSVTWSLLTLSHSPTTSISCSELLWLQWRSMTCFIWGESASAGLICGIQLWLSMLCKCDKLSIFSRV